MSQVKTFVEECACRNNYEDFARYMFSVAMFDGMIEFNYIHPMVLQPNITPSLRTMVSRIVKNHV